MKKFIVVLFLTLVLAGCVVPAPYDSATYAVVRHALCAPFGGCS